MVKKESAVRQRMEPSAPGPSCHPFDHSLWSLATATSTAERSARRYRFERDRGGWLFVNSLVAENLAAADFDQLMQVIGKNVATDSEARSVWFDLHQPIEHYGEVPIDPVLTLQVKGVVFDAAHRPDRYDGFGWRPEYYFAGRDAVFRRYHPTKDAVGRCVLSEAVREYVFCLNIFPALHGRDVAVPVPIAWGSFDEGSWEKEGFGFVVLGLPAVVPGRADPYYAALDRLLAGDFGPMAAMLELRGHALSVLHRAGALVPFRHFANMSLTARGGVLMHDLGDRTALLRRHVYSPAQFVAEAFTNLAFALAPAEHVVIAGAPRAEESRALILDNLDLFTRTTLAGYFKDADTGRPDVDFELVERTFLSGFEIPFHRIDTPLAKTFREFLRPVAESAWTSEPFPLPLASRTDC